MSIPSIKPASKLIGKLITGRIKLEILAQKASPTPPIGPALGQKGLNIMEFCKAFNEKTKTIEPTTPIRVSIIAYSDKTFTFTNKGPPTTFFIKKVLNLQKGSSTPGLASAGTITWSQIKTVTLQKMETELSARSVEQAMKIIAGSARSMGLKVIEDKGEEK